MRTRAIQFLPEFTTPLGYLKVIFLLGCLVPQFAFAQQITISGKDFLDLTKVGNEFGLRGGWVKDDLFRLSNGRTTIDFTKNSRLVKINRMPIYLGFSTVVKGRRLLISVSDYQHALLPIIAPKVFKDKPGIRRVVIDVGHGGKDTGACNHEHGLTEKELAMDVSIRLKQLLEKVGFEVELTRRSDRYVPLEERSKAANRSNADLFISLHFNSAASSKPCGFETFALTPQYQPSTSNPKPTAKDAERFSGNDNDPWNMLAAYYVQRGLVEGVQAPDRGVKRARFLVLKELNSPGVLVELGFLSHKETAQRVRSAKYRESLAQSLCRGILDYRERLKRIQ